MAEDGGFKKFLELPGELREYIYEHYFEDDKTIFGPRGQPHTKHAVSLLFANHQLFIEAMRFPFECATLTLNMRKQFAPEPHRDYAWCMEHTWKRSEFRAVGKETMSAFKKAVLDVHSAAWGVMHWQYAWPIVFSYLTVLQDHPRLTVKMNVGRLEFTDMLIASPMFRALWAYYGKLSFTKRRGPYKTVRDKTKTEEELQAAGAGRAFLADYTPGGREVVCLINIMLNVAILARKHGWDIMLENQGGPRTKAVGSDNVHDLVAEKVALDAGKDVWMLVG
ncbi:hypothetical protein LTR37_018668 [Vermiconidia calcicola]|uniref:Uncharacterized protein n=1 Tax=Vermiconidia calcicola TaxID=1690605 RepID=A0ACC3MGF4_9PEZI|nr:hypothetical protein LTR37_018668 [Vermiconidia calcicola]